MFEKPARAHPRGATAKRDQLKKLVSVKINGVLEVVRTELSIEVAERFRETRQEPQHKLRGF